MKKRNLLAITLSSLALAFAGCATDTPTDTNAKRRSIDADADLALASLFDRTPGSRELFGKAKGVLIFPKVFAAGLVVGGSHGDGALRVESRSRAYYTTSSASVGLTAGVQTKSVFVLFLTEDSLTRFQASDGWTVGADASIAVISAGVTGAIDTRTARAPVVGFVLTTGGLMADLSLDGTKFSKLDL